jgi:hypothetical protein
MLPDRMNANTDAQVDYVPKENNAADMNNSIVVKNDKGFWRKIKKKIKRIFSKKEK